MSSEPELPRPTLARCVLAVLACALWACVWIPVLIGVGYVIFEHFDDWIERQVWIVSVFCKICCGLALLAVFAVGTGYTSVIWARTLHGPTRGQPGATFGRHAKWRPGYTPPEPDGTRCPKCEFNFAWDGTACGHCGYVPTTQ